MSGRKEPTAVPRGVVKPDPPPAPPNRTPDPITTGHPDPSADRADRAEIRIRRLKEYSQRLDSLDLAVRAMRARGFTSLTQARPTIAREAIDLAEEFQVYLNGRDQGGEGE